MPDTRSEAFSIGAGFFAECVVVRDFMRDKVRPLVQARVAADDPVRGTVYGTYLRAFAWMHTLSKLNEPSDFQAMLAAARALFEATVDLAFFLHDPTMPPERMFAWERSAKLVAAERTRDYWGGQPNPPPGYSDRVEFIAREGAAISADRQRWWPNRPPHRHPDRWTGRSLREDAREADTFADYRFREFYDGRFSELCWGTHGSGLAGVRGVTEHNFPGIGAMALQDSARFGMHSSRIMASYVGLGDDEIVSARFRQAEKERRRARALAFGEQRYGVRT